MSRSRGVPSRPDLLYRNAQAAEDPRWTDINEKIIDYMHKTDISEWPKEMWQLMLLRAKQNSITGRAGPEREQTSSEDLLRSLLGSQSSSID